MAKKDWTVLHDDGFQVKTFKTDSKVAYVLGGDFIFLAGTNWQNKILIKIGEEVGLDKRVHKTNDVLVTIRHGNGDRGSNYASETYVVEGSAIIVEAYGGKSTYGYPYPDDYDTDSKRKPGWQGYVEEIHFLRATVAPRNAKLESTIENIILGVAQGEQAKKDAEARTQKQAQEAEQINHFLASAEKSSV